jgi:hypothetical protein
MTADRLNDGQLLEEARRETGFEDFGDPSFREPMRRLIEALNGEARLNDTGRAYFAGRIRSVLITRLRAEDWFRRHPEILEEEIGAPLAIVGLPRTGTTMMHRTISADHRMYSPLWYEVRYPVPMPGTDFATGNDPRIALAEAEVRAMLEASPELASIHPMDARGPDEDIMLLEQSFFSTVPESYAHMPDFGVWLERQDQRPGYRYLKRLLQFLQWQKKQRGLEAERWVLKAPHHIHFPAALFETFPDVKVLQTHRDPLQLMPSYGSMMYALTYPFSDAADKAAIARHWCEKWATGMHATMRFRDAGHDDRFLDMWYEDTVSSPLDEIQRLYDFVGVDLTAEARAEMARWRDMNRREARPTHQYTLEEYGFTEEGLKNTFREYRERYILSRRLG